MCTRDPSIHCLRESKIDTVLYYRSLERPRRRWEDNIKMDLKSNRVGRCGLDSSGPGYGPVAGFCEL